MIRKFIKQLIYVNIAMLLLIVGYKVYLQFHEPNFLDSNFESIKKIEETMPKDDYSFVVFGSVESSIGVFQNKIIGQINKDKGIAFAVSTGDAVLDGAEDKYQILHQSLKQLKIPTVVGIGTREISDGGDSRFYRHFGPYFFSYTYGTSYFIFIDTTGLTTEEVQKDWITSELSNAKGYEHIFVFMNDAPVKFTDDILIQTNHFIENVELRTFLVREFAINRVDGVFTNGTTMYAQKTVDGIPYYISGGTGGLLNKGAKDSAFHYLRVDVNSEGFEVKSISEPLVTSQALVQKVERLWIVIHSIFYVDFVNVLLGTFAILLIFLLLYRKASASVGYYRDFRIDSDEIKVQEKLTIAMFTDNYFPFIGGVPISIRRLTSALRARGHRVVIFAPEYPIPYEKEKDVNRFKLFYYHKRGLFQFPCTNTLSPKIEKSFNAYPFDIIHAHHPFFMGRKGVSLAKKYGIPVVFTYHTRIDQYAQNIPFMKLIFKNILSHRMVRKFGQKCNGIVAPTTSAKEYLENIGVSRHKIVLPTGVDFGEYHPVNEVLRKEIISRYAAEGEVLLCSASRLAIEKNLSFLIEGLKIVKAGTDIKFRCLMIGDGPEKENLQRQIEESDLINEVVLLGQVAPCDMATYFQTAEIFVFSSLSETQGMVILEAMAGGCPAVCIRSSGTDDVVQDGYNGFKTMEEPYLWAEKVIYLLENKQERQIISSNATNYVRSFSEEKIAERAESFYKKTIIERIKIKGETHGKDNTRWLIKRAMTAYIDFVYRTSKVQMVGRLDLLKNPDGEKVVILFWHGDSFCLYPSLKGLDLFIVVTKDRRGDFISDVCEYYGYHALRIPDATDGGNYLFQIRKAIAGGTPTNIAVTLDGPIGIHHVPKDFPIVLATLTRRKVMPIVAHAKKSICLTSRWDRLKIPLPFNHITIQFYEPIVITREKGPDPFLSIKKEIVTVMESK